MLLQFRSRLGQLRLQFISLPDGVLNPTGKQPKQVFGSVFV